MCNNKPLSFQTTQTAFLHRHPRIYSDKLIGMPPHHLLHYQRTLEFPIRLRSGGPLNGPGRIQKKKLMKGSFHQPPPPNNPFANNYFGFANEGDIHPPFSLSYLPGSHSQRSWRWPEVITIVTPHWRAEGGGGSVTCFECMCPSSQGWCCGWDEGCLEVAIRWLNFCAQRLNLEFYSLFILIWGCS